MAGLSPETWVRVGVLGRPHGIRGALKLHLDNPDGQTVVVGLGLRAVSGATIRPLRVQTLRSGVVTFDDVADRDAAVGLVNAVVEVRRADFVEDEDDEGAFLVDLVGSDVVDVGGNALGVLKGFVDTGMQLLAEVRVASGAVVLVPFVPPIVQDTGPPIVLAPPGGLFDPEAAIEANDENEAPAGGAAPPATESS
jgi:16S rRNA processing protein RimM